MNKHLTSYWRSSSRNHSAGRQKRLSFFLWIRARAIKQFQERGGLALTAAVLAPVAAQAQLVVDTLSDDDAAGFTLREAIAQASGNPDEDEINFDPGLSGTLTLTQGELSIADNLTINGPESGITISGNQQSRIFTIGAFDVSLSNLSLTQGNGRGENLTELSGGAIFVQEANLVLTNCEISNNASVTSGGGIQADLANLTLTDCVLTNNTAGDFGGGVNTSGGGASNSFISLTNCQISDNQATNEYQAAGYNTFGGGVSIQDVTTATVTGCTITGNTAGGNGSSLGGGIGCRYTANLTIEDSLFSDNETRTLGGGLLITETGNVSISNTTLANNEGGFGGGGLGDYGNQQTTLTNCTLHGNTSAFGYGAGLYTRGTTTISILNSTITGNDTRGNLGGGIFTASNSLLIANSIVAFNSDANGVDVDLQREGSNFVGFLAPNLFSELNASLLTPDEIIETDPANVFAVTSTTNETLTGTLADNGGPVPTVLILSEGAAQNAGSDTDKDGNSLNITPELDARGLPRIVGDEVDLGAVELQLPAAAELLLCFDEVTADGSAIVSFELNQTLAQGEEYVVRRSTDLTTFDTISSFDGTSVTTEELGNSSEFDTDGNIYTITDADALDSEPKAFYRVEIGSP